MGFRLKVNGEEVWESEYEASSVTNVSVRTAAGEATAVGSPGGHDWIDIVFTTLSPGEEMNFHSNQEAAKRQEMSERIEEVEADRVTEGRQAMEDEENERELELSGNEEETTAVVGEDVPDRSEDTRESEDLEL